MQAASSIRAVAITSAGFTPPIRHGGCRRASLKPVTFAAKMRLGGDLMSTGRSLKSLNNKGNGDKLFTFPLAGGLQPVSFLFGCRSWRPSWRFVKGGLIRAMPIG